MTDGEVTIIVYFLLFWGNFVQNGFASPTW